MVARAGELGRLAPAADLHCILLGGAVRHVGMRRVRQCLQRGFALGFGRRELLLGLAELLLDLLQLLDLLRRWLPLELLPGAEVVHGRNELAPALVGAQPGIEGVAGALACECRAEGVGIVARGLRVDQAGAISASGTRRGRRAASWAGSRTTGASRSDSPTRCSCPDS